MIPRYSRKEMSEIWSDIGRYTVWLEVELLALEKMEQLNLAPKGAAADVRSKSKIDLNRIAEIENETKHDVISFVSQIAESAGPMAGYLHRGMTSNDLLDTAFAVQLKKSGEIILAGIDACLIVLARRAREFRDTPCIGRTHGIHAEPTTFGVKLAGWYAELYRARARVAAAVKEVSVGKISGAVGTYQGLPPSVEEFVLGRLGLTAETVPTQIVQRDRHAAFFSSLALLATSIERFATEIRHLQRTEVREAEEFFSAGQKGSSAMPHKRNPILSENLCGLARLVRGYSVSALENVPLWHERDISHSSAERVLAPDSCITVDFMLHRFRAIVDKLVVYPERMIANINLTGGLVFSGSLLTALVDAGIARDTAYKLVQQHALAAWEGGASLMERIKGDSVISAKLTPEALSKAFDLKRQLVHTGAIIDRALQEEPI